MGGKKDEQLKKERHNNKIFLWNKGGIIQSRSLQGSHEEIPEKEHRAWSTVLTITYLLSIGLSKPFFFPLDVSRPQPTSIETDMLLTKPPKAHNLAGAINLNSEIKGLRQQFSCKRKSSRLNRSKKNRIIKREVKKWIPIWMSTSSSRLAAKFS